MKSTTVVVIAIAAGIAVAQGLRGRPEHPAAETSRTSRDFTRTPIVKTPQRGGQTDLDRKASTRAIRLEKRPRRGRVFRLDSLHFDICKATAKAVWLESLGYETRIITSEVKVDSPQTAQP
jgi:hypothetical protein